MAKQSCACHCVFVVRMSAQIHANVCADAALKTRSMLTCALPFLSFSLFFFSSRFSIITPSSLPPRNYLPLSSAQQGQNFSMKYATASVLAVSMLATSAFGDDTICVDHTVDGYV